ncbi:hypothetical protein JW964_00275 [candidate division KSB1 bacterium]|nr:hypothetical protein [candidate division KSB1 bacterium]
MNLNLIKIWRPSVFHGNHKKNNYFEGYFFKLVDATGKNILAIIPGIFIGTQQNETHAFIQILDGQNHRSTYHRFPIEKFSTSNTKFKFQIGENIFQADQIDLNLDDAARTLIGKVKFSRQKPWPVRFISPGVMGWYRFVPFMECYHGVLSMDHSLSGTLSLDQEIIDFTGGRGYIEKDWGKSFPSAYIWIQSNHFEVNGISFFCSVAKIPWLSGSFRGFLAGFLWQDRFYRFTTYTGAVLESLQVTDSEIKLKISDKKFILMITAVRHTGGLLHAPYDLKMLKRVSESLNAEVKIHFYEKISRNLLFSGSGQHTGLDVNGKLEEILEA